MEERISLKYHPQSLTGLSTSLNRSLEDIEINDFSFKKSMVLMLLFVSVRVILSITVKEAFNNEEPNIFLLVLLSEFTHTIFNGLSMYMTNRETQQNEINTPDLFRKDRLKLYALAGSTGIMAFCLIQVSYKYLDITLISILMTLQIPATMLFQYLMLKRDTTLAIKMSTVIYLFSAISFIYVRMYESKQFVDVSAMETVIPGFIAMMLYLTLSGASNVYYERAFTADRQISEMLFYHSLFSFITCLIIWCVFSPLFGLSYFNFASFTNSPWILLSLLALIISKLFTFYFILSCEDIVLYASSKTMILIFSAIVDALLFNNTLSIIQCFALTMIVLMFAQNIIVKSAVFQSYTLIFPVCTDLPEPVIVLGMYKRGMYRGLINGFGGKISQNETDVYASAYRELYEETGLDRSDGLELEGSIMPPGQLHYVFVIPISLDELNSIKETEEAIPSVTELADLNEQIRNQPERYSLMRESVGTLLDDIIDKYSNYGVNDVRRVSVVHTFKMDPKFLGLAYKGSKGTTAVVSCLSRRV